MSTAKMAANKRGSHGNRAEEKDDDPLTLAEAVTSDLVLCDYCGGVYSCPLLLPCLHTFCQHCVVAMVTQNKQQQSGPGASVVKHKSQASSFKLKLQCPTCQVIVTLTGNGDCAGESDKDEEEESVAADDDVNYVNSDNENDIALDDDGSDDGDDEIAVDGGEVRDNDDDDDDDDDDKEEEDDNDEEEDDVESDGDPSKRQQSHPQRGETSETGTSTSIRKEGKHVTPSSSSQSQTGGKISNTRNNITTKASPQGRSMTPRQRQKMAEATVKTSLPLNHFLDSMSRLYRHRSSTDSSTRNCAYCKTDGVEVGASSLCLQCLDDVCDSCANAHRKTRVTRDHRVVPIESVAQGLFDHDLRAATGPVPCVDHLQSPVSHFCSDCLIAVCRQCRSRGAHHGHKLLPLANAVGKFLPEVEQIRRALIRSSNSLSEYAQTLSERVETLTSSKDVAINEINRQAERIVAMIEERREQLCGQLEDEHLREASRLETKKADVRISELSTRKSAALLRHLVNLGRRDEQMSLYAAVVSRHRQLVSSRPKVDRTRLGLSFQAGPTTEVNVAILMGRLDAKRIPMGERDSQKSQSLLTSLMPTTLNPAVLLGVIDANSSSSISNNDSNNNEGNNNNNNDGNNVSGQRATFPSGMAVRDNLLALVDRENQKVKVFDLKALRLLKEFTGGAEDRGKTKATALNRSGNNNNNSGKRFKKPFDVVFLPNGVLAVTDPEASRVGMYEWTGKFIGDFKGEMKHPRGITLNAEGEVVVLDSHLRRLTIHDATTGVMLKTVRPYWGPDDDENDNDANERGQHKRQAPIDAMNFQSTNFFGDNNFQKQRPSHVHGKKTELSHLTPPVLIDPSYVHVTGEGNFVISDAASPNIKIIDPNGKVMAESMDYGTGPDQNLHPSGVCVDKYGYVLVADTNNKRIHLGLPDGQMTESPLLSPSDGISHPVSLCLTQDGHVAVGQSGGQVSIYKYVG